MPSRRTLLKGLGVSTVPLVASSNVIAKEEKSSDGASEDLKEEVGELLRDGKIDEAKEILDNSNVYYQHTQITPDTEDNSSGSGADQNSSEDGSVSTEDVLYDPGENPDDRADINLTVVKLEEAEHHYAVLGWDMLTKWCEYNDYEDGCENNIPLGDSGVPKDGAGITFNQNAFYVEPDSVRSPYPESSNIEDKVEGVKCKWADAESMEDNSRSNGALECKLRELEDYETPDVPVYGHYIHTWHPFGVPTNLGITVTIPGPASLGVSATGTIDKWKADDDILYEGINSNN